MAKEITGELCYAMRRISATAATNLIGTDNTPVETWSVAVRVTAAAEQGPSGTAQREYDNDTLRPM
jgi:hypothetical protein